MLHLLLLLAAPPQGSPAPLQTPKPVRYRYEHSVDVSMDMSAMMASMGLSAGDVPADAGNQSQKSSATFSVTTRDSAGGKLVHIVLDSSANNALDKIMAMSDAMPPEMMAELKARSASAVGQSVDLFLLDGKQSQIKLSAPDLMDLAIVAEALPLLFPPITGKEKIGATWGDTVTVDTTVSAMNISVHPNSQVITLWKRTSQDLYEGDVTQNNSMGGMNEAMGPIGGTTTGKSRFQLGKDGMMGSVSQALSGTVKVSMPMLGGEMTGKTTTSQSLTRLP